MAQIESVNNNYTQAASGMQSTKQDSTTASLFSTMLTSMMNQATSSIADFSESDDGLYDSSFSGSNMLTTFSSLLQSLGKTETGSTDGTTATSDNNKLLAMILMMMLMSSQQEGGMSSDLITSLFGSSSGSLNSSLLGNSAYSGTSSLSSSLTGYANSSLGVAGSSLLGKYASVSQLGSIPSDSWKASNPTLVNHVGERSAGTYRAVIDQFNVESNERYRVNKLGTNDTYCNVFAWDVSRAMGAEIPHYINASTGEPSSAGGANTLELNANSVNDWLNSYGKNYGWVQVSAEEAQNYANQGMPAVTSWKNANGHGHMQVVSPSSDGQYNASRGVAIAQAGRHLYNYNYITSVYGQKTLPNVQYFVHI